MVAQIIVLYLDEKERDFIFNLAETDRKFEEAVLHVCRSHDVKFYIEEKDIFMLHVRYELDMIKHITNFNRQEANCQDDIKQLEMLEEVGEDIEMTENVPSEYSSEDESELLQIERDFQYRYTRSDLQSDLSLRANKVSDIILSQDENVRNYIINLFHTDQHLFKKIVLGICKKAKLAYTS